MEYLFFFKKYIPEYKNIFNTDNDETGTSWDFLYKIALAVVAKLHSVSYVD